ncbi:Deoxynucleoside triphosphate triphosphohydrolase SAMHD1-like protein [Psilocybe cubensis]|nr:Deoxynucleoside triphosphate triphosphohydrolase SAMHD1-like protein [Psilocybe cubensis]KAH9483260.1 Deoxynucleoside triphosphate triphosphohydrolase SAMHD1-like protein [Psilocybe cubensis]
MFDSLIKNNKINMSLEDQNFVKALIAGDHTRTPHEKKFLFDIIANKTNGLDVDKLDYLCRDTAVLNMRMMVSLMSLHRLLSGARVDPQTGHICYIDKDILTVETFFLHRRYLHNNLYNHKTVTAIGYMIGDAFIAADNYMKLSEAIYDPERYITLDDHIMKQIKESDCPELAESRKILERITSRDLYRKAGSRMIRCSDFPRIRAYVTPDRIAEATILCSEKMDSKDQEIASVLQPSDIIVHFSSRHFGMGEQNPMDILKFYSRDNLNDFHSARSTGQYDPQEPVCQHFLLVFVKQEKFLEVVKAGYKQIEENFIEHKVAESSPPAIDSA